MRYSLSVFLLLSFRSTMTRGAFLWFLLALVLPCSCENGKNFVSKHIRAERPWAQTIEAFFHPPDTKRKDPVQISGCATSKCRVLLHCHQSTYSLFSVALLSLAAYTKKSHIFLPPSHHPSLSLSPFHLLSGTVILNSCSGLQWKVLFRVANHSFCPCLQHIHFNQIWKKDKQKSFIPQNQTGCLP